MLSQNLVDAVEYRRAFFRQPGAQRGDLPIVGLLSRGRLNPPQPKRMLSIEKLLPMNPQLVAQLAGVAAVRLLLRPLGRLNDDDFSATVFLKHFDEPRIHAADFKDGEKAAFRPRLFGKIGKEGTNLLPLRAHLPLEDHRSVFASQIHRQLTLVLVDTEV